MRTKDTELIDKILDSYSSYYTKNLCAPSFSEMAKKLGVAKSTIGNYVKYMVDQEMLEVAPGNRGYIPAKVDFALTKGIPQLGYVSCGMPFMAEENIERYIPVRIDALNKRKKYFFLVASGDSMIGAGINNGDLVLVRQENEANEGDIIVALTEEGETTLKTLYYDRDKEKVVLHPENPNYPDICCKYIEVQGVAEMVMHRLNKKGKYML